MCVCAWDIKVFIVLTWAGKWQASRTQTRLAPPKQMNKSIAVNHLVGLEAAYRHSRSIRPAGLRKWIGASISHCLPPTPVVVPDPHFPYLFVHACRSPRRTSRWSAPARRFEKGLRVVVGTGNVAKQLVQACSNSTLFSNLTYTGLYKRGGTDSSAGAGTHLKIGRRP